MEKNVVVPTRIHTKCPNSTQDIKAPHSSMFQGLMLLIETHLKRTLSLSQKPFAAANSSSLLGRCSICGIWRYFDTDAVIDSCSAAVGFLASSGGGPVLGAD